MNNFEFQYFVKNALKKLWMTKKIENFKNKLATRTNVEEKKTNEETLYHGEKSQKKYP